MFVKIYNFIIKILVIIMPFSSLRKKIRNRLLLRNNKILVHKKDGKVISVKKYKGLKIEFKGQNSTVNIFEPCVFKNSSFVIGSENLVEIQASKYDICNLRIPVVMSFGSNLIIGKDFSCFGVDICMHAEPKNSVTIGDDCMFSSGISIWPSDGHTIYDINSGKILNEGKEIIINDHVWLGIHSKVLKGSVIPKNSVVGANSIFTSSSSRGGGTEYMQACLHG